MKLDAIIQLIEEWEPCADAMAWLREREQSSPEAAWRECGRGDWMLWLVGRAASRRKLVLAACECARLALRHVPTGEERPLLAIETAEAWARRRPGIPLASVGSAAAASAADATARQRVLKECSDIVRKHFPQAPRLKG